MIFFRLAAKWIYHRTVYGGCLRREWLCDRIFFCADARVTAYTSAPVTSNWERTWRIFMQWNALRQASAFFTIVSNDSRVNGFARYALTPNCLALRTKNSSSIELIKTYATDFILRRRCRHNFFVERKSAHHTNAQIDVADNKRRVTFWISGSAVSAVAAVITSYKFFENVIYIFSDGRIIIDNRQWRQYRPAFLILFWLVLL